jgi:hypothetical protein
MKIVFILFTYAMRYALCAMRFFLLSYPNFFQKVNDLAEGRGAFPTSIFNLAVMGKKEPKWS